MTPAFYTNNYVQVHCATTNFSDDLDPPVFALRADREELDKAQAKWLEEQEKYEETHLGNFRRIYPCKNHERYDKFFHSSGSLYQETAAFKARSECARSVQPVASRGVCL